MDNEDRRRFLLSLPAVAAAIAATRPASAHGTDPQNTVYLDTKDGRITIRLRPDLAPKHVAQIKSLVKRHFYDGVVFHRVIDGFMAQTGDPTGTGTGKSEHPNVTPRQQDRPVERASRGRA